MNTIYECCPQTGANPLSYHLPFDARGGAKVAKTVYARMARRAVVEMPRWDRGRAWKLGILRLRLCLAFAKHKLRSG